MSSLRVALLTSSLLFGLCLCQQVIELQTKTGSNSGDQMDLFSSLDITLINLNFESCIITEIDPGFGGFDQGDVNVFFGADLKECFQFPAPGDEIPLLILAHSGSNGWGCEWVDVYFNDGHYVHCPGYVYIDSDEDRTLECNSTTSDRKMAVQIQSKLDNKWN